MAFPVFEGDQLEAVQATAACLDALFGENAIKNYILFCLSNPDANDGIKCLIVDCLTNPDTSPLTKEMLGDIIQGKDVDEDGVLGAVADDDAEEGTFVQTSTGIKILTVTGSIKKSLVKEDVKG